MVDEIRLQNDVLAQQRHYKLEEMIRRNLITSAALEDSAYKVKAKDTIKTRYTAEDAPEVPDDIIQQMYKAKNA